MRATVTSGSSAPPQLPEVADHHRQQAHYQGQEHHSRRPYPGGSPLLPLASVLVIATLPVTDQVGG